MSKLEIGMRIKDIRESMNMSKESLAKFLGITGQYLGMIEHGNGSLSPDKLEILCRLSGKSADYILFGRDYSIPENIKKILDSYTVEQLDYGCRALEELALFLKYVD